jgi:hypothetical protein
MATFTEGLTSNLIRYFFLESFVGAMRVWWYTEGCCIGDFDGIVE